jgi:NADPH:quinone reductase-like Zn-dependent oxidoreductase
MGNAKLPGGLGGKTVFLPGALSGTGASAVQLAKRVFGVARVITTLSPGKICKAGHLLGEDVLDRVIDYTAEEAGKAIEAGSVDFMYDNMGGAAMASLHLMKKGGVIVSVSGLPKGTAIKRIMPRMPWVVEKAINGVFWVSQMRAARYGVFYDCLLMRPSGSDLKRLAGWIEEGKLRPVVGRTASFTDLEDVRKGCQEVYDAKGGVGKFVIEIVEDGRR